MKKVATQWVWQRASDLEKMLDNIIPGSEAVGYTTLLEKFLTETLNQVGIKVVDYPLSELDG
jgi:hypothetical protein